MCSAPVTLFGLDGEVALPRVSLARSSITVAAFSAGGILLGLGATVITASVFGASRATFLLRFFFPFLLFPFKSALRPIFYYSNQNFLTPLKKRFPPPATTITCVLLLGTRLDVMSLVIATLLGAVLQCAILAVGIA